MKTAAQNLRELDKKVRQAVLDGLIHASDDLQSTGRDAVRQWKHKVDFSDTVMNTRDKITVTMKPKGSRKNLTIWGYVEFGTKPHLIPKVVLPGKILKFKTGYSARTAPVAKYNQGSGQSFGSWRSAKQVRHPGTKPRDFLVTFLKQLTPALHIRVTNEIKQAIN